MNRVLSWPPTPIVPGLLQPLKQAPVDTVVTDRGSVRFHLPLGAVEMQVLPADPPLPPGTPVRVWWKGGGFVCAPLQELKAEARHARTLAREVAEARARLQAARQEREARDSEPVPLAPLPAPPDHPLLSPAR